MSTPLIVGAKLARPLQRDVLPRARLVDRLLLGVPDHELSLIVAGPGYGKTTLLAEFARAYAPGTVWYSLGGEDADFSVFLWHLAAGLGGYNRRFGRSLQAFLKEGNVNPTSAAGAFQNDCARLRTPLAVVLDDFHHVSHVPAFSEFLTLVLENAQSPVRFILASRLVPMLPLARLRARRRLLELGPTDLAFNREELRALLEDLYPEPVQEPVLDLVSRATEGWVAAVHLIIAAHRNRPGTDLSTALRGSVHPGSTLHDYLAEEILGSLPDDLRRVMLRTSIFEDLDPDVLRTVLEAHEVDRLLDYLLSRRLLVTLEGGEGPIHRYHALLRDFLGRRVRNELEPAEILHLHVLAAQEYVRRGDLVRAANHLAQAQDPERLATFLRDHSLGLVEQGHYQSLLSWFEALPPACIENDPWLRLRLGDVRYFLGDLPGAELEYERAHSRFRDDGVVDGAAWATLGLARIWNLRGQPDVVVREGDAALQRLRVEGKGEAGLLIPRLIQVLSGARFYLGQYREALSLLDDFEQSARGDAERQAAVWNNRAVLLASQGNYQAAARAFERGLERPGARSSPRAGLHIANLAILLSDMGDNERAEALFREALGLARSYRNRSQILTCLIGLARLHYRLRNTDRALEYLREVESINSELKLAFIESDALALRARILADSGQFMAARSALSHALAAYGASRRDANWLQFRVQSAAVELDSGRVHEAYRALQELYPLALESESLFPRAMLLLHLGDAERRLGATREAEAHLREAFRLSQEMGYDAALSSELARNLDMARFLLDGSVEPEYVARLLARLGPMVEPVVQAALQEPSLPVDSVRGMLSLLAEVGGPSSHRLLSGPGWETRRELAPLIRGALAGIERRYPELASLRQRRAHEIRLVTLGRLAVSSARGEVPVSSWRSHRSLSLFVYLAVKGTRGVSKDRLIEVFWPAGKKKDAEKNFHPTLSYIRRALREHVEGPVIVSEDGIFRLAPEIRLSLDLRDFERALDRGRRLPRRADRVRALKEAVTLYQGDFLGDRYEAWGEDLRAQLSLQYEDALTQLASIHLEDQGYREALTLYTKLLDRNPYQETIHCKIMLCHHGEGDRRSIRDQYESLKGLLRGELGVEPLPETRSLYDSLMVAS